MSDSKPVLEVRNLTVALPGGADRAHAVEKVSFTVNRGEIVCLVGESGSGKSVIAFTVMGLLAKALKPTSGEILLEGENVLAASETRLRELRCTRMSMIFQEPMTALNPVMTCGQQIDEVLATHTKLDTAARKAKIIGILTRVQLPEPERIYASYPHQLSGGQRQRIMIAMALVLDPVLLIADEPTTALDVTTQAEILKLIAELQAGQGTGVLFITHDFGVVAEIAHRVAVLRWGELVEMGPMEQVLSRPSQPYTKMLISSVPSIHPVHRGVRLDGATVLRTDKLGKTYSGKSFFQKARSVRAAADVDLDIRRGETLGIVGESGSGKSTVARCIARLIDPTEGKIYLGDTEIAHAGKQAQAASPPGADRLPGSLSLDEPAHHRGRIDHRRADELRPQPRRGDGPRAQADGDRAARSQFARPLSAPVLGWATPAHLHRPRARHGARAANRRRGGLRTRRLGAEAGAAAARRDPRT